MSLENSSRKRHTVTKPIAELIAYLCDLQDIDATTETRASRWNTLGCGLLGITLLALAVVAELDNLTLYLIPIVGGILSYLAWAKHGKYVAADLPNDKLSLLMMVFTAIQTDVAASEQITLEVDLRDCSSGRAKKPRQENGNKTKEAYTHDWLTVRGVFANGHSFHFTARDTVRRKTKSKPKKTLVVNRVVSRVRLRIKLTKDESVNAQDVVSQLSQEVPEEHKRIAEMSANNRVIDVSWTTKHPHLYVDRTPTPTSVGQQEHLLMLMWVYNAMAKAQKVTKSTGKSTT